MTTDKFKLANLNLRNGDFNQAIELYKGLINVSPLYPFYYTNLSYAYKSINEGFKSYLSLVQAAILLGDKSFLRRENLEMLWNELMVGFKDIKEVQTLVIVSVYNSYLTVEQSLLSVLNQTCRDILVVAIDDGSNDQSIRVLKELETQYQNLLIFISPVNQGTYSSINLILNVFFDLRFNYFCIHGADDIMNNHKIELQIQPILDNGFLASAAGYKRISRVNNKCLGYQEIGHSMVIYKKKVLEEIGYYDNTRFGGDSEYLSRFKSKFGVQKLYLVKKPLTLAYYGVNNLSYGIRDKSVLRELYSDSFKAKHKIMTRKRNWYLENQFSKEFSEYNQKRYYGSRVICGVATIESRLSALPDMVGSILAQIDKLIVYQNGYKKITNFLNHEKIEVISSLDTGSDMGDAGKFYKIGRYDNCYYFSLDDDLIYPPNYVDNLIKGLNYYNNEVILSYHGRTLRSDACCYYKDYQEYFRCLGSLDNDRFVHFGGTGVMGFHTSVFKVRYEMLKKANMADIWIGLIARKQNIPIVVRQHAKGWINYNNKVKNEDTIYKMYENNHVYQNSLLVDFDSSIIIEYKYINS